MPIQGFFSDTYIHLNASPGTPPDRAHTAVPYVFALVYLKALGKRVTVAFLLDTGADTTTLHPEDSLRIMTDAEIKSLGGVTSVGGAGANKNHYPTDAVLIFLHDDNHLQPIEIPILVAEPAPHNQQYPSLLGRDALGHFTLSFDQTGRTFSLV